MAEERTVSRLNGKRGVSLLVRRQSGENTVEVAKAVKQELARIRAELPPGYEMAVALDSSVFITAAIRDVGIDIAYGAALAAFVVLLFLRNVRSTAITALAIPSSLVASFVFFYAFGFTLNTMTLMALSLSIGMLIDDAIVVLENVYRHMEEEGETPAEAASIGTDEIGLAVVATTLATCAVFVPIAFMAGIVGRFFREFGLVATSAVLVSMLVSLTLTPMLCARYLRVQRRRGASSGRSNAATARSSRPTGACWRRGCGTGRRWSALALAAMARRASRSRAPCRSTSSRRRTAPSSTSGSSGRSAAASSRRSRWSSASRRSCARCRRCRSASRRSGRARRSASTRRWSTSSSFTRAGATRASSR